MSPAQALLGSRPSAKPTWDPTTHYRHQPQRPRHHPARQGDLQGARTLHERALAIRETHLGADHPDTATSLSNLATVLADQGDLDGARALLERALAIREGRLGPDHPTTARSRGAACGGGSGAGEAPIAV